MCFGKIPFNCLVGAIDRINLWPSIDIEWIGQSYIESLREMVGGRSDIKQGRWLSIIRPNTRRRDVSSTVRVIQTRTFYGWCTRAALICDDHWRYRRKIRLDLFCCYNASHAMVGSLWAANHRGRFDPLVQDHEPDPVIGGKGNPLSTITEPQLSRFMHVNSSGRDVVSGRFRGRVTS